MKRSFLQGEAQARFTQDRIDQISLLAKLCVKHKAQSLLVCGDVFDSNQVAPQTVLRAVEKLKHFPVPVFILPGNHDPLNAVSVYQSDAFLSLPDHITVIRDNTIHTLPDLPGVEFVGAPWFNKQPNRDLCKELLDSLTPASAGHIRIVLAHGQLDSLMPDADHPTSISIDVVREAQKQNKLHYLALGDRHSVTDADASGRIWYSGTPVATDFSEIDANSVLLVDASVGIDPRPQVEPISTGNWHFERIDVHTDNKSDIDQLAATLNAVEFKERTSVRLAISGALSLINNAALEKLIENKRSLFASLQIDELRSNLAVLPDQLEHQTLALSGYAQSCWNDLAEQAGRNDEQAALARDALALMYRLVDAGDA